MWARHGPLVSRPSNQSLPKPVRSVSTPRPSSSAFIRAAHSPSLISGVSSGAIRSPPKGSATAVMAARMAPAGILVRDTLHYRVLLVELDVVVRGVGGAGDRLERGGGRHEESSSAKRVNSAAQRVTAAPVAAPTRWASCRAPSVMTIAGMWS